MAEFVIWLYKWRQYSEENNTTFLATEPFKALSHTMNAMVYMMYYSLNNNPLDYILELMRNKERETSYLKIGFNQLNG